MDYNDWNLEDPTIDEITRYGTLRRYAEPIRCCPVCEQEADSYFLNRYHEIIGCEHCIKEVFSEDYDE